MSQPYQFQPQHSGLTRLSVNEVAAQRAAIGALGMSDIQAALDPIIAILLANCDIITSDETIETLVLADETSTDILGPGL